MYVPATAAGLKTKSRDALRVPKYFPRKKPPPYEPGNTHPLHRTYSKAEPEVANILFICVGAHL